MGDINIKQLESLRWRMRVIETLTVIGTAWIALAVYQKKEELVYYLVGAVVLLFLLKYYTQFRLRKRQFVSNLVEQRTMELRFQRDAMQAESEKLSVPFLPWRTLRTSWFVRNVWHRSAN